MRFKTSNQDDVAILAISGKIMGGSDRDKFHDEIKRLIAAGQRKVLLDFGSVPWINSTGLGILISGYASLKQAGGRLMICNVNDRVLSLFYTAQLHDIFETHETKDKALEGFA
ncbi:STAS domain-containing protein [bacterium]|nr:STAS domain-containing protein [bacterium]MBU1072431.1 STAS domain-containing protein [bacterium]MBU1674284.1 STAS domain-containing protein [bacterium]